MTPPGTHTGVVFHRNYANDPAEPSLKPHAIRTEIDSKFPASPYRDTREPTDGRPLMIGSTLPEMRLAILILTPPPAREDRMIDSMTDRQKGVIFYVLTLIMAVAVALLGPDDDDLLQILNMATPTIGVLLMLLVLTPDGYRRAGWAQLALHRPGWRAWPLALIVPTAILCVSYGAAWLVGVLSFSLEA